MTLQDAAGRQRLDDPNDYTRLEISTALQRNDVRVIPVLVEGSQMPGSDDLPDDLKPLARRNVIELNDKRWEYDVSQLVDTFSKALHVAPTPKPPRPEPIPPRPIPENSSSRSWTKWAWGIEILIVIIAAHIAEEDTYDPPGSGPEGGTGRRPPVAAVTLSGNRQDAEGGSYRLVQQGVQVVIQCRSPHGTVAGRGMLQGKQLSLDYTVNGYPYHAVLLTSPDGLNLLGQYRDAGTGDSGPDHLQRAQ